MPLELRWSAAGIGGIVPAAAMFEPHSFLWRYLWAAPNVLVLVVAAIFWRRGLRYQLPVFFTFATIQGLTGLAVYVADHMKSISPWLWWELTWVRLVIEIILKFALIGAIFSNIFEPYSSISKMGRKMIRGVGAALVLACALVAALAPSDAMIPIVRGAHLLEQADFIIESGLLVFVFLFAMYFGLAWSRLAFGVALGLGLTASVELGSWAVLANLHLSPHQRTLFNFLNMAIYHVSVLIWLYYVLTTTKWTPKAVFREDDGHLRGHDASAEERLKNLDVWNRELENLLRR